MTEIYLHQAKLESLQGGMSFGAHTSDLDHVPRVGDIVVIKPDKAKQLFEDGLGGTFFGEDEERFVTDKYEVTEIYLHQAKLESLQGGAPFGAHTSDLDVVRMADQHEGAARPKKVGGRGKKKKHSKKKNLSKKKKHSKKKKYSKKKKHSKKKNKIK